MVDVKHFHWADYLVFGIFLTVSAGIGFFFGWRDRKKTSVKEFLTGGKKMHWIPVALSMQASFLSAIFILSTPVEFYYFGTTYYYLFLTYIVALPISAHLFLSVFYKMNLLSAYEYLEVRFNKPVRIAGASTFCLMMILYMPVVLYTPAIALAQVTGLPINISILLCGSICTLYTFLGGMKATVWNDFLQMVVIIAGLFCIIIIGTLRLGGIKRVWEINEEGGRIILNEIDPTIRTTFWTQFVGGSYVSFSLYTSSQTIIQKFLSVRSLKDAYKSIYLDTFTSFLFITLVALVGILCYAFYATCDPLSANRITKSDQLVPLLVMEVLSPYPGLPGLFIATTFSAALSSLSGGLNAMSAVAMTDFICPLYNWLRGEQMTERFKTILSKALVFGFGVFSIGSGYVAQFLGDSILQISISIFGFVGGPLTALLVLGVCFPFVNCWGAITGLVMSLTISSWMAVGSILSKVPLPKLPVSIDGCLSDNFTTFTFPLSNGTVSMPPPGNEVSWFYRISHFYYAPISLVIALVVAIPVSLITGPAKNTEPELIVDWGNICFRKRQKPTVTENKIEPFGQVRSKDSKSDFENSAYFGDNEIAEENYLKNRKLIYSTKL